eukprot:3219348-Rhodomonas_salina.1
MFTLIACSPRQGVHMTHPNGSAWKGGHGRQAPPAASRDVVKANNKVLINMLLKEVDLRLLPVYFQHSTSICGLGHYGQQQVQRDTTFFCKVLSCT